MVSTQVRIRGRRTGFLVDNRCARLAVLHATFYASSPQHPPAKKADVLIPISNLRNDTGNDVSVPPAFSVILFPSFHLYGHSHNFTS